MRRFGEQQRHLFSFWQTSAISGSSPSHILCLSQKKDAQALLATSSLTNSISSTAISRPKTNYSHKTRSAVRHSSIFSTKKHYQRRLSSFSHWLFLIPHFCNRKHGIQDCDFLTLATHFSLLWERASEVKYIGLFLLGFSTLKGALHTITGFSLLLFGMLGTYLSVIHLCLQTWKTWEKLHRTDLGLTAHENHVEASKRSKEKSYRRVSDECQPFCK